MKGQTPREPQAFEIMSKPVETLGIQDRLSEAVRLFTENHIGAAAVLDLTGKPVGVITKTDILRYQEVNDGSKSVDKNEHAGFHEIDEETVGAWMTPVIFSVKPETTMKELAKRMVRYGIHHIFVQARNGQPLGGIVSSFDVLRKVADPS